MKFFQSIKISFILKSVKVLSNVYHNYIYEIWKCIFFHRNTGRKCYASCVREIMWRGTDRFLFLVKKNLLSIPYINMMMETFLICFILRNECLRKQISFFLSFFPFNFYSMFPRIVALFSPKFHALSRSITVTPSVFKAYWKFLSF